MIRHLLEQPLNSGCKCVQPKVCSFPYCEKGQPGAPDFDNAGNNTRSGSSEIIWSQQYGGQCPQCKSYTKKAYKHGAWRNGRKIRYHRCPACGCRFKSIAKDCVNFDFPPDPELLEHLRKYK